jgi:hypothetical protein
MAMLEERGRTDEELHVGMPRWITPELITETIRVWQSRCERPISREEAVEMILQASRLMEALKS